MNIQIQRTTWNDIQECLKDERKIKGMYEARKLTQARVQDGSRPVSRSLNKRYMLHKFESRVPGLGQQTLQACLACGRSFSFASDDVLGVGQVLDDALLGVFMKVTTRDAQPDYFVLVCHRATYINLNQPINRKN